MLPTHTYTHIHKGTAHPILFLHGYYHLCQGEWGTWPNIPSDIIRWSSVPTISLENRLILYAHKFHRGLQNVHWFWIPRGHTTHTVFASINQSVWIDDHWIPRSWQNSIFLINCYVWISTFFTLDLNTLKGRELHLRLENKTIGDGASLSMTEMQRSYTPTF